MRGALKAWLSRSANGAWLHRGFQCYCRGHNSGLEYVRAMTDGFGGWEWSRPALRLTSQGPCSAPVYLRAVPYGSEGWGCLRPALRLTYHGP